MAEKYYDISPYAWCGNNPVKFVDPDGSDIKFYQYSDKGIAKEVKFAQLDINTQKALILFTKTKEGYNFLKQFATAGESFGNKSVGGVIKFSENGKFSQHDYNIVQMSLIENSNYNGDANVRIKGNLKFDIRLNTKRDDNNPENIAITIAHESFIHLDPNNRISKLVDLYEQKDIKGFNEFRNATILRLDKGKKDHVDYINKRNDSFSRMTLMTKQNPILINAYNNHNKNYTSFKKK